MLYLKNINLHICNFFEYSSQKNQQTSAQPEATNSIGSVSQEYKCRKAISCSYEEENSRNFEKHDS